MAGAPFLYFDRSLGKALPEALRILRVPNVVHHHTPPGLIGLPKKRGQSGLFAKGAPDDEWLSFVSARNWVSFSQDYKMHLEEAPLDAIKQHKARVFYLWGSDVTRWEKMRGFARAYGAIIEASSQPGPFVWRVTQAGKLQSIAI